MEIIEIKLSELKPYEKNPRRNDEAVDYVANSIKEFGFKVPLVIDKDNVIVTGHTRFKASQKLGLEKVPCIRADDLTEEQIKAYRVADNKVGEFSAWDFELLNDELAEILDIDMDSLGFIEEDFNHIEDLMTEEFIDRVKEPVLFTVSFVFPITAKTKVEALIDEKGKDYIVDKIIEMAGDK